MTREEALAVAAQRKAARQHRTGRIRKTVAGIAVAAFVGPFAVIYANVASGKDPALANNVTAVATASRATSGSDESSGSDTTTSGTSGSTTTSGSSASGTSTSNTSSTPAAVTTQQS